ncbi:glutathione S- transferase, nitrogen catabolite repression regulator [Aspergillus alliaceus]|uniref:Glutathione S- transferase, nitrogen catabolite repression regulator n=1 Tax=Petromyces alliaceus TaxID=209559 RepID=A0A8H6A100_PETAA|nr:glutathione S- transferase, nitrogen catabolite repression regulator [Aspergillus burnettii]
MQSIILHSHPVGPIPWKVAIILEDLNLPYETHFVSFKDVKNEPFIYLNLNGRLPAIEDPTTKESLFRNPPGYTSRYSGQGPYYGQAGWFHRAAPERILTAIERYGNEIRRGTGVLETVLKTRE